MRSFALRLGSNTIFGKYSSSKEAAAKLNPERFKDSSARYNNKFLDNYINREKLVVNELGSFYFVQNPNTDRQKARKVTVYVWDKYTNDYFHIDGIRPCTIYIRQKYVGFKLNPGMLYTSINKESFYKDRFKFSISPFAGHMSNEVKVSGS